MGLFSIFGSGLSALTAYSGAMSIVANNVANASNEGYSRQRVNFESLPPDVIGGIETGRGIQISSIEQVVNENLEKRLLASNYDLGRYEARSEYLNNIASTMNEVQDSGGLNSALSDFFNAWTTLTNQADNTIYRQNVLNTATVLTDTFHNYSTAITNAKNLIDDEVTSTGTKVNAILDEIADLNQSIKESSENTGYNLRDNRRNKLNELAEYIDVNYVDTSTNFFVFTKSGQLLVSDNVAATLSTTPNAGNGNHLDVTVTISGTTANVTSLLQGGRLKGLVEARDTYIDSYGDDLDDLAYTLVSQINTYHNAGFNLSGGTGNDFFADLSAVANSAANIDLDSDVSTTSGISVAGSAANVPGSNAYAYLISNLANSSSITFQDTTTNSFSGYLGNILSNVGIDTGLAEQQKDFKESIVNQITLDRQQVSGVNVNEEQIELMKMQSAYEAATKLVRVADDMITALLAMLVR